MDSDIKFIAVSIAAFCFTTIYLLITIIWSHIQKSVRSHQIELFIEICLIAVYIYAIIPMINETKECHQTIQDGCPRQLTATVSLKTFYLFIVVYDGKKKQ